MGRGGKGRLSRLLASWISADASPLRVPKNDVGETLLILSPRSAYRTRRDGQVVTLWLEACAPPTSPPGHHHHHHHKPAEGKKKILPVYIKPGSFTNFQKALFLVFGESAERRASTKEEFYILIMARFVSHLKLFY